MLPSPVKSSQGDRSAQQEPRLSRSLGRPNPSLCRACCPGSRALSPSEKSLPKVVCLENSNWPVSSLPHQNSGTCPNQVPSPPCLRGPHDQEWSPSWSSMNWKVRISSNIYGLRVFFLLIVKIQNSSVEISGLRKKQKKKMQESWYFKWTHKCTFFSPDFWRKAFSLGGHWLPSDVPHPARKNHPFEVSPIISHFGFFKMDEKDLKKQSTYKILPDFYTLLP